MSIAQCAVDGIERAKAYYVNLETGNYLTGLIATIAWNIFAVIATDRRGLDEKVMFPIIAELFAMACFLCFYNLTCLKTSILALANEPRDLIIAKVDEKIAKLANIFVVDYKFQARFISTLRIGNGINGIYFYGKDHKKMGLLLSLIMFGVGAWSYMKPFDESFLQKLWSECKA